MGGGPVPPGADVLVARQLVAEAGVAQLERLLRSGNAAVRAHVAREIIRGRATEIHLIHVVAGDGARIRVGSMNDVPPITDRTMTISRLVREELAFMGLTLPPFP